jgi:hypothetical protein
MRKECPNRLYRCPNKCDGTSNDKEKKEYHISELEGHFVTCLKQLLECSKCKATFLRCEKDEHDCLEGL